MFVVQDEIKTSILGVLNLHFAPEGAGPRTTNPDAYNAFLKGRYNDEFNRLDEAVTFYEQAVALDPNYANAYSRLAGAHLSYIWSARVPALEKIPIIKRHVLCE